MNSKDSSMVRETSGNETDSVTKRLVDLSVIVPVSSRAEDLGALYREYAPAIRETCADFEFLFIAEPWQQGLLDALAPLRDGGEPIRVLTAGQVLGESALVRVGVSHARGKLVATLPAYRRVVPAALPELVRAVQGGADLAVGRRWPRHDSWVNRLQNRLFHYFLGAITSQEIHDVACGVQVMRWDVADTIPLYGDWFRFIPILAAREGFAVQEVKVKQHGSDRPGRIYSPGVYLRRAIDLLGLLFLTRFTEKPLRFFGLVGSLLGFVGAAVLGVVTVQRFGGRPLADRPLLLLGVLLVVLGVQVVALGLVGEIIVHIGSTRKSPYRVSRDG